MKKLYIYLFSAATLLGITTSCNDFGDVNVDKENPNENNMDYTYVFTHVQSQISGSDWDIWRNGCIYSLNMLQQTSSVNWSQGVFYTYSSGFNSAFWDNYYSGRGPIRNLVDIIEHWKNDPAHTYEYQYARVMKAYLLQRMTDMYGDVPYFDAGLGQIAGISNPKYDTQKAIYDNLLLELDEVNKTLTSLPNSESAMSFDVLFNGNSEKWRKFANSLMLRVAMRLSKVDPVMAKTYVNKAVKNGLFADAAESAILVRVNPQITNDSAEPFGKIISNEDAQAFYLSEYFVKNLKTNSDPRLHLLGTKVKNVNTRWTDGDKYEYGNSDILDSIRGLPIGYESSTEGNFSIYDAPGFPYPNEKKKPVTDWRPYYALINRYTFARPDGPSMLVTYAQNCLLLAEAVERGYISGNAQQYFKNGVKAAMQQYSNYKAATTLYNRFLNDTAIDEYIANRMTAFTANPIKEINWEYYVLTFGDPYETFSNWRRSGYPELSSVYAPPYNRPSYPNSVTNEIPRRFTYPTNETSVNNANYQEAVSRLVGGDKMSSRVWWDVK